MITGNAIQHAEICRLVGALCIEINTGLKVGRRSSMQLAKLWCGSSKQTKKGVLIDLVIWFYENGGELHAMWGSVGRALDSKELDKLDKATKRAAIRYQQAVSGE